MIYAGTWKSDDTPFDPEAKVLFSTPAGGVASLRRRGLAAHPCADKFRSTMAYLANYWNTGMPPLAKWVYLHLGLLNDRRYIWRWFPYGTFTGFATRHFANVWTFGKTKQYDTPLGYSDVMTSDIDWANPTTQQIQFTIIWTEPWPPYPPHAEFYTYMVKPTYASQTKPVYATRLVDLHFLWDPDCPNYYRRIFKSPWRFATGDTIALFWRMGTECWYDWQRLGKYTVP